MLTRPPLFESYGKNWPIMILKVFYQFVALGCKLRLFKNKLICHVKLDDPCNFVILLCIRKKKNLVVLWHEDLFFLDQIFWYYNDDGDNDFTIFNAKNCSVPYISRWTRSVNNRVVAFPHGRYIRSAVESESETETEEETTTTIPTTTMAENTEKPLQDPPPNNIRHHKRPPRVHIHNIRLV